MLFHMECTDSCKYGKVIFEIHLKGKYTIFFYLNLCPKTTVIYYLKQKLEKYSFNLELQATVVLALQNTRKLATSEYLKIVKQVVVDVRFLKIST